MRIIVRAFNAQGYHRDIMVMNEHQVLMNDYKVCEPLCSLRTGLIGHGGSVNPLEFPEMTHFEIVFVQERNR